MQKYEIDILNFEDKFVCLLMSRDSDVSFEDLMQAKTTTVNPCRFGSPTCSKGCARDVLLLQQPATVVGIKVYSA